MKILKRVLPIFTISTQLALSSTLQDGIEFFNNKEYEKSYQLLNRLSFESINRDSMERQKIDFYLGRSAFETKKFGEAMFAFERVLIENQHHERSRLELGRTLFQLEEYESAKVELLEVLRSSPPDEVQINIQKLLIEIEKRKDSFRHKLSSFISLEVGYDTNIGANPTETTLNSYLGDSNGFEFEGVEKSFFHSEMGSLNYVYDFGDEGGYSLSSTLFAYNQNYLENSEYNIVYGSLLTALTYSKQRYKMEIPIQVDRLYYGGEALLNSIRGGVNIFYSPYSRTVLSLTSSYRAKNYEDMVRDSNIFEVGGSASKSILGHNFYTSMNFQTENAKNSISVDNQVEKDTLALKVRYRTYLYSLYSLELSYVFRYLNYRHYTAKGENQESVGSRADKQHNYTISTSRDIGNGKNIKLSYTHISNQSNHLPVDYSKSIYSISLNLPF